MKLGIGIDTGGTYTDAVIYDFEQKEILGAAKALTTREDLSAGILAALDQLPLELVQRAELLSLSTTLATNACVEDKVGRAKLIFFGGDARTIDAHGGKYGLPPAKEILLQESYTDFSGRQTREVDWALFQQRIETGFDGLDGVGIVEMHAMKDGAAIEKKAAALFKARHAIPVVCGHELFSELNSLQRGASTLLNAGLFPVIQTFLTAIKAAMAQRDIRADVVIVRSDGSLMSERFAALRPVETLLCGPAASALGGRALSGRPDSVIVDMGGTTTDIALMKGGQPISVTDGVHIGRWKTYVGGLYIKTVGLGGDSAIHYREREFRLESYRVVPLCVAAARFPSIVDDLKALDASGRRHTRFLHEHYLLMRDIADCSWYTEEERAFCRALRNGPLSLEDAAAAVGKEIYTLEVSRLLKEGVVQLCGLTPTDIMHIRGDFSSGNPEAALLAARFVARNLECTVQALCEQVYDAVKRCLYVHIVKALLENRSPGTPGQAMTPEVERFLFDSYECAKEGRSNPFLSFQFQTSFTLVGLGAPIRLFLPDVAALLGAPCEVPEHSEVANALGAVMGMVSASHTVEIRPSSALDGPTGYTVFGERGSRSFEDLAKAEAYAARQARAQARAEAARRGAVGQISVTSRKKRSVADARGIPVYLGTTVTARAVAAMGFDKA